MYICIYVIICIYVYMYICIYVYMYIYLGLGCSGCAINDDEFDGSFDETTVGSKDISVDCFFKEHFVYNRLQEIQRRESLKV